jgi:hypothetical protein
MIKIQIPDTADRDFLRAVKSRFETKVPLELPIYTVQHLQTLTAANYAGHVVRCSNGDAGSECLAYCDGFNWRVVQIGSNVSL